MDNKIIIDKALKGEDYSKEMETIPEDKKTLVYQEVNKALKEASDKELAKVSALRKEGDRIVTKKTEEDLAKEKTVFERFQNDQLEKAKRQFFTQFPLADDAAKNELLAEYGKRNSGSVDSEMIFNDLKKAYAYLNSDNLLENKSKLTEYEKNAANFNASMANASGGAGGQGNQGDYSKAARELYTDWLREGFKGKTLDDAQKLVDKGTKWKDRNLAA